MCTCKKYPQPTPIPKDIEQHLTEAINEFNNEEIKPTEPFTENNQYPLIED
jgi:hypothetical protein